MNSILQLLFHIPKFRAILYSIPRAPNCPEASDIILQLHKLFVRMEHSKVPLSTLDVTESFV
jgi:hypothetical protein